MKRKKEQPKAVKSKRQPRKVTRKRVFHFTFEDKSYSLTHIQKLFCDLYLNPNLEVIDVVKSAGYEVVDSNGFTNEKLAWSISSENLRKPNIKAYIKLNLDSLGLTETTRDRELSFVMTQRKDLSSKNKALDMFNKMKGGYVADSAEAKVNSELADALARIRNEIPD